MVAMTAVAVWFAVSMFFAQESVCAQTPLPGSQDVVSFAAGATILQRPTEYSDTYSALMLIDESPRSLWSSRMGSVGNQVVVIALSERTLLKSVSFDTSAADLPARAAKDVLVEVSDSSATAGYQAVASVSLRPGADDQLFPTTAQVAGRWVRLTVRNNHGAADYVELAEFRATGTMLTRTVATNLSGSYDTKWPGGSALMHVRQQGTSLIGCYDYREGTFTGGIEGHVVRLSWHQTNVSGPAVLVVSADGRNLNGLWWIEGSTSEPPSWWDGVKTTTEVGTCAHWSGDVAQEMADELRRSSRARVYGVNFDFNSDRIREESRPALEDVVTAVKSNRDWRVTIEGHTDGIGTVAANQSLSERRAAAVKAYLVKAGIDAARLNTAGFGASRPIASNNTEIGRAQNRRVELVRR
jgi:outer membrane protein OmpA-like peptidoglycan-associated protein